MGLPVDKFGTAKLLSGVLLASSGEMKKKIDWIGHIWWHFPTLVGSKRAFNWRMPLSTVRKPILVTWLSYKTFFNRFCTLTFFYLSLIDLVSKETSGWGIEVNGPPADLFQTFQYFKLSNILCTLGESH